jgi:hypothetical protein
MTCSINSRSRDVWSAKIDAEHHYNNSGWHEGRDPNAFFSTSFYLWTNPDVAAAGFNPLAHFDTSGWREGRLPSVAFDPAQYPFGLSRRRRRQRRSPGAFPPVRHGPHRQ